MKMLKTIFRLIAVICMIILVLVALPCVVILTQAVTTLLSEGVDAFADYILYEKSILVIGFVTLVVAGLGGMLKWTPKKRASTPVHYSTGNWTATSGEPEIPDVRFNAGEYVDTHCEGFILGLVTEKDIRTIEDDPSLSYEEKEAAKSALESKATWFY